MPSLKETSAELTNEYVRMLCVEAMLKDMGADAPVRDINRINLIRAEVNMADEAIRYQLTSKLQRSIAPDPDADCP